MNREARRLHLTHTHYSTPVGLDDPANYSSPYDLARLAGLLERNRFFARTVDRPAATLTSGDHPRTVVNRNTLVRRVPWVNGVKTGHTLDAGYCLVASGKRGRLGLISVVLGTPSESARDADALRLLRYGYANWRLVRLVRRGEVVAHRRVHDKDDLRIAVLARRSVTRLLRRDQPIALTQNLPGELTGPLPRGALVGQLVFHSQGRVLARVPLVTARAVPAVHPGEKVARFLGRPGTLIPLMAAVVTGAAIVVSRRRRAQRRRRRADVETAA
jgi:D-alanyl-D-alanine carboxypeptidase (penicillin-binding protein 5/6)